MRRAILFLAMAACGGGLTAGQWGLLENANKDSALEFRYLDASAEGGNPMRALARGAYCGTQNVLLQHGKPYADAGVECQ